MSNKILSSFFIILLVLIQNTKCSSSGNIICRKPREFQLIIADTVLADYVMATYNVSSQAECLFHCYKIEGCQSYNYQYTLMHKSADELGLCEISNNTMDSCPLKRIKKQGHGYFEERNVEKPLFGSEKNPGMSCLDIGSCSGNDGEYWISSEQTAWNVVKVYCYMNTLNDVKIINLAKGKPATQSSTSHSAPASRAVDGNKKSHFFRDGTCTHTLNTMSPWWRVDLQNVFSIRKLIITNRSDCCSERLSDFEIRIGISLNNNGNSNPLCGGKYTLKAETKNITCPQPMIGRYVNIIIPGSEKFLTLCEVEAYP